MARAITKTFGNSSTIVTVRVVGEAGLESRTYTLEGNKSERACRIQIAKVLKSDNFMLVSREVVEGENEETYSMDADTFLALAQVCEDGKSYGHDTITAQMKATSVAYYTLDSDKPKRFTMSGVTTERKLRNKIVELEETQDVIVLKPTVSTYRVWMPKDKFMEYATKREN